MSARADQVSTTKPCLFFFFFLISFHITQIYLLAKELGRTWEQRAWLLFAEEHLEETKLALKAE